MKRQLLAYWARYCKLDASHCDWLEAHAHVMPAVKAGDILYEHDAVRNHLYFVLSGLLAVAVWDAEGRRHLLRLALPDFSLLTTQNLHTDKQQRFTIIALRNSTVIRIPVAALRDYQESCTAASVLVHVLREKMFKQLVQLNELMGIKNERERYARFCEDKRFRHLLDNTIQQEQADYLNVSINTIQRYRRGRR